MVWASNNFLSGRITLACPVMEFFHPYKKLLEDVWRAPELFYTFFAPLCHSLNPKSPVKKKPRLKLIDSYFTMLRLLWPEFRAGFHTLHRTLKGKLRAHLQNILLVFEFFIPIVSLHWMFSMFFFTVCGCFVYVRVSEKEKIVDTKY
jgi:hypothetical protein